MRLHEKQRIEIILRAGSGWSSKDVVEFNRKHGANIPHDSSTKFITKFLKYRSVINQPSGRRRTASDEEITATILSALKIL